jgi:DNA-binding NarL/FixJ family response regulator
MPYQDEQDLLEQHHDDLSRTERRVLLLVGRGRSDEDIAETEVMSVTAVHSCVRRFRDRTGLAGRLLTAWAGRHQECCISVTSQRG